MRGAVLPVMGVLMVVAGAVGMQIGESAIAQIDPVHFQGAPPEPHDVTRDPRPAPPPAYADASGWAEGYEAMARDCGDCPMLLARHGYAPASSSWGPPDELALISARPAVHPAPAAQAEEPLVIAAAEPAPPPPAARYSRYLDFPVNQDQAELARAVAAERDAQAQAQMQSPRQSRTLPPEEPTGL